MMQVRSLSVVDFIGGLSYFSVSVSANSQVTNHLPSKPDLITGTFMKHTPGGDRVPSYTNTQEDILGMLRFRSK